MNCYDTIDHLLSSNQNVSSISELEEHLQGCPRCRSLVEVISPMLGDAANPRMTEESSSDLEWLSLGASNPQSFNSVEVAQEAAKRLEESVQRRKAPQSSSQSARREHLLNNLKFAAAFLVGVAASFGGIAVLRSESVPNPVHMDTTCLLGTDFDDSISSEKLVRSCMACHIASN